MKTSLQWVSTGPMLSLSLVQRLWPPTQDNGWLSALPTELCNYHHNHSQQRPHSAGCGKLRTRYLPFKASTEHCRLLKGLCQNSPLPTPLVLTPRPDPPTHFYGSPSAIQLYRPRLQAPWLLFWTPDWPGAWLRQAPGENLVATF